MFQPANLKSMKVTTTLESRGGDQPLDLRSVNADAAHISYPPLVLRMRRNSRLVIWLGVLLLLGRDLAPDYILAHVVLLREVKELANLGCTLGAETFGQDGIGEARKLLVAFLDDDK